MTIEIDKRIDGYIVLEERNVDLIGQVEDIDRAHRALQELLTDLVGAESSLVGEFARQVQRVGGGETGVAGVPGPAQIVEMPSVAGADDDVIERTRSPSQAFQNLGFLWIG